MSMDGKFGHETVDKRAELDRPTMEDLASVLDEISAAAMYDKAERATRAWHKARDYKHLKEKDPAWREVALLDSAQFSFGGDLTDFNDAHPDTPASKLLWREFAKRGKLLKDSYPEYAAKHFANPEEIDALYERLHKS